MSFISSKLADSRKKTAGTTEPKREVEENNLLKEKFFHLCTGLTTNEIFMLSRMLMKNVTLDAKQRYQILSGISSAIAEAKGDRLPAIEDVNSQVMHYGGLAVKPALSWMQRIGDPKGAAQLLETMVNEGLLADSNFADSIAVLYQFWPDDKMKQFWSECFSRVGSYWEKQDVIIAFALDKIDREDEPVAVSWLIEQFNQSQTSQQRQAIVRLWEKVALHDDASIEAISENIMFPLFERHGDKESSDLSAVLLAIYMAKKLPNRITDDLCRKLEMHLDNVLQKTPELWKPVEYIANKRKLTLGRLAKES